MTDPAIDIVRRRALRLDLDTDLDRVLELVGDATLVLIGEASHGTHEFYRVRADITRALVTRRGFNLIAVEADWPDAYRANRWVRLAGPDVTAEEALTDLTRFPRWMWRNRVVVDFLRWLRQWNTCQTVQARAAFYGLDLYSLHRSVDWVLQFDVAIHIDTTRAVEPLERWARHDVDLPETYPTGV